jgi:flavodoxin
MANPAQPRKGGEELPEDVQDRPEQNRGYDDAVRGTGTTGQQDLQSEDEDEFDDDDEDEDDEDEDTDAEETA